MIYKKSVVLASVSGGKQKGVLTLEYDGTETTGSVKLYNFDNEPEGILSLGVLCDDQVFKAGLNFEKNNEYSFKLSGVKNLNVFSCAVVNLNKGEARPILMGATNGVPTYEERLANSLCILDNEPNVEEIKQTLDQNQIYLEEQDEIEQMIEAQIKSCDNKCAECHYRDAFFKQEDVILNDDIPEKADSFFDGIKEQINALFDKYPEEDILKQIIPDSKWVKIDYEEKGEYYVVGVLYEHNQIKYVCYGIPSVYEHEPPAELKGFAQWLPIDGAKQEGFGYWITYQDADTGENVVMEFETL